MKSLGQIAYEAYATKVDWKSPFTGQTLKEWDTLKIMNPIVAEAWECAGLMVAGLPRVKVGPEQTQMSTTALIDTRLTIPGESIGTVVSTHETIRAVLPPFRAARTASSFSPEMAAGRPPTRPRRRAAANPATTHSRVRARSYWASAPNT